MPRSEQAEPGYTHSIDAQLGDISKDAHAQSALWRAERLQVRGLVEPLEVSVRPRSALVQVQALLTFIRVTVATDGINLNKPIFD